MFIGSRHSARFKSHLVVRTHPDVSFHHYFEHGSGAFVLTCGCCWVMVSVEYATGETSGYWYVVRSDSDMATVDEVYRKWTRSC